MQYLNGSSKNIPESRTGHANGAFFRDWQSAVSGPNPAHHPGFSLMQFFHYIYFLTHLFLAVLGLWSLTQASSSRGKWGIPFTAGRGASLGRPLLLAGPGRGTRASVLAAC